MPPFWQPNCLQFASHTPDVQPDVLRTLASEIYSLGCVLYYVLVGHPVYGLQTADSLAAKMAAHFYLPAEIPSKLPPKWQTLLQRMLDKNPQTRIGLHAIEPLFTATDSAAPDEPHKPSLALDFKDEISLLQRMAQDGVAYAQTALGEAYRHGELSPQDDTLAADWFEQAALKDFAPGQTRLGLAYLQGRGRAFDFVKAVYYFELSAAQEHAAAQYYLGVAYEYGLGVKVDQETALAWYTKAAQNASRKAYQALGRLNIAEPLPLL